ncbi:MAG TPA: CocE/NonD family hydrolase [Gaiellaceae bacterium]|nr:CocE/NonD family hydrolase [Gaiellaceae bacterium]
MGLRRFLVVAVVALACAGPAAAAAPQELTVTATDGTALACGLVLPDGAPPEGGWPGLLLFHGLGQTHAAMEAVAESVFAPAGYASLACDARGTGASGGAFGLDGPAETQDARDLFAWLAARPDVSDTQIGAYGVSLGGGAVWNAAVAGVPFAAIAPSLAWTSLGTALAPQNVPKAGIVAQIAAAVPAERWDPELAAARDALLGGAVTAAVTKQTLTRSARNALQELGTPTLILQGRRDYLFDLDQALTAYRLLPGPKRLYVGDLGHAPAANPADEAPVYLGEVVTWFDRWLRGTANGIDAAKQVELAHDPWDGRTSSYAGLPATRTASVALPGTATLLPGRSVSRAARLTGGPHESFGGGSVVVRYSGAKSWPRLVATVYVAGSATPVTLGAARIGRASGVVTIKLLDEVAKLPRGRKLVVTLAATSGADGVYTQPAPAGASITVGRATLKLSLLRVPTR